MLTSIGDPNCVWLTTGRQTTNIYEKYMSIFKIFVFGVAFPEKKFCRIWEDEGWTNYAHFFVGMSAAPSHQTSRVCDGKKDFYIIFSCTQGFQTAMQAPTLLVLYTHIFVQAFKNEAEEILGNCKCMIYFLCIHIMAFIAWPKGYLV